MREKISISVDSAVLGKADALIDGVSIRNRSQAIEHVLREHFRQQGVEHAVILLGRLKNIIKENILHILSMVKQVGVSEIIIAGGPNNAEVFKILGTGKEHGVKVDYLEEKALVGTAGVIYLAKKMLSSTFVVLAGDTVFSFDLAKMVESHRAKAGMATMGITAVKLKDSTDSIIVEGDKIVHFSYQDRNPTYMTNAGVYLFEPAIFSYLPKKGSLEKDVFPKLAAEGKLNSYVFYREWKHNE